MDVSKIRHLSNVISLNTLVDTLVNAPWGQERMGCFYGPSGWGKTSGVCTVELSYGAICIEVPESVTKRFFLTKICDVAGVAAKGSIPEMVEKIAAALLKTDRPLVIDDAQYLLRSKDMMGLARDIYNAAGKVIPVVLVGEEELPEKLTAIENLHNRISVWEAAQPCGFDDAWQLIDSYAKGIQIDEALMVELVRAAQGSHRRVSNSLCNVRELARSKGSKIATLEMWGNRSFVDGSVPAKRSPKDLRPKIKPMAIKTQKARKS